MDAFYPAISCICVTRNRALRLEKALYMYEEQTYPNKELVIVIDSDDLPSRRLLRNLDKDYRVVISEKRRTLGELRNLGIASSSGEYFCQWDDDDWHHKERLCLQMSVILENCQDASVLTNWMIYDEQEAQAYFSMFRLWEGSIMCKRSAFESGVKYPSRNLAEDTVFLNQLTREFKTYPLSEAVLYIYVIHNSNSWSAKASHFKSIKMKSQPLGIEVSNVVSDIVSGRINYNEGSYYLRSKALRSKLHYFFYNNLNTSDEELSQYLASI